METLKGGFRVLGFLVWISGFRVLGFNLLSPWRLAPPSSSASSCRPSEDGSGIPNLMDFAIFDCRASKLPEPPISNPHARHAKS